MRLRNQLKRIEEQMRALRCAWCLSALSDTPPPLPFLPRQKGCEAFVIAICWRCGTKFNIEGGTLRDRQARALYYSTHPAKAFTDELARAVITYVISRQSAERQLAGREDGNDNKHDQPPTRRSAHQKKEIKASMSRKARERLTAYRRAEAEFSAELEKLHKQFGDLPSDMQDKTFAELEIIIFGDACDEAHALDARMKALKSGSD